MFDSLRLFYGDGAGEPLEYTLPTIWDKLMTSSNFNDRVEMVKKFNQCNKWRKKGLSRVPILHEGGSLLEALHLKQAVKLLNFAATLVEREILKLYTMSNESPHNSRYNEDTS
ncbi:hypothetical protein L2E82_16257 [Cichorium intybus]|uniref:Uncharacterized protein n=1 Tax=Cichorium intybus TaxID=13427 RepID=A0ACB9F5P2_CICIN|nr:hypothetical protein L2E82_16257 [Cichorium intybus]